MKITIILIVAGVIVIGSAQAQVKKSDALFTPSFRLKPVTEKIDCSTITDELCEATWDKNHQGFLHLVNGDIKAGDVTDSDIRYLAKVDLEAFADSETRLPPLLKKTLHPYIVKLKNFTLF